MADTKTADEWKAAAAKLDAQIGELERQQTQVQDQLSTLRQQQVKLLGATRNQPANSPERQQYVALSQQIAQLENQNSQISQQIQTLDTQLQAAERQAGVADTAPANTKKNTAPASAEPGSNTDPAPVQEPTKPAEPANVDPASEELTVPPGADPDEGAQQGLEEPEIISNSLELPPGADADEVQAGLAEPPLIDDELTVPPGADQEEEGRQPGLAEPPENVNAGVVQARNSGNTNNPQPVGVQGIKAAPDWRFRITLGPSANYLYKAQNPGILKPLQGTNGVIFPYTPSINVTYAANYETSDIPHSNFKIYNYRNSSVESISITGDFTAQDTFEANYVLAVIHFFRSVTKMFYGQDSNPARGLPPPLVYLTGHGDYAFDHHPAVIQSFQLTYPNDVDYINATIDDRGQDSLGGNLSLPVYSAPSVATPTPLQRLGAKLSPGGYAPRPGGRGPGNPPSKFTQDSVTRVPTKLQIIVTALPVVTRANYSNRFSLKDYATGKLLRGTTPLGGIW
jgi:hypothetical protein